MAEKRGGIIPAGEGIRSALQWLSERRREDPAAPRLQLIEQAALQFDLTPVETEFLLSSWKES